MKKLEEFKDESQAIVWKDIHTKEDLMNIPKEYLYDRTVEDSDVIYEVKIRPDVINNHMRVASAESILFDINGQEPWDYEIAEYMGIPVEKLHDIETVYNTVTFFSNFTRGIVVVNGDEGSGKDLLTYFMGYIYREYFNMMPCIDAKPRDSYGLYAPFSVPFLREQLDRVNELTNCNNANLADPDAWKGIFIKRGFIHLTEGSNWMHRFKQTTNKGFVMGQLMKNFRHLEFCCIFCDADKHSLDPKQFMPRVTCDITAIQTYHPGIFRYYFQPIKYSTSTQQLNCSGKSEFLELIGDQPHPCLDGKRPYDIYNTKGATFFELPKNFK